MKETIHVPVIGMTCGGCVNSVTRALKATPGVSEVEVSLERAQATVTHDPDKAPVAALRKVIVDAGFETR
jgi:copper chaperone